MSAPESEVLKNPAKLMGELQQVQNLVATLEARLQVPEQATGLEAPASGTVPVSRVLSVLKHVVQQAEESVHIGMGKPELMHTDAKIETVVQSLIAQILDSAQADDEAVARTMVDGALGTTVEEKRSFLLADILAHGMVGSKNVQEGVALSARVELALVRAVAEVLDAHLGDSSEAAFAVPVTESVVDEVTAMLLEAEANMGKPIVVEKDGLLG